MAQHKSCVRDSAGITSSFLSVKSGLHNYLSRFLIRPQDIEDVVQETFLRAYESEQHQEIQFPKSFLFKIAKNIALTEVGKKASRVMLYMSDVQDLNIPDWYCVEDDIDGQQKMAALTRVVAALPPQCQRVVVMKKTLGLSHQEIGDALDISARTVERHLAKALRRCQQLLHTRRPPTRSRPARRPRDERLLAARER